ncbi:hypothetical protein BHE74_00054188 [Ensete ventricosum]|uniref:Uncharacterized protein n=1 Tax=Ensete ventricosum TaxID=4639 RepID=A0A445MAQ2_ENSVE|nr:hypothetical protein BHE74_00054188 [Ensete ventricosum]RZR71342.1 hypothetical protein BHM03_00004716 [Ensete ventricosum]
MKRPRRVTDSTKRPSHRAWEWHFLIGLVCGPAISNQRKTALSCFVPDAARATFLRRGPLPRTIVCFLLMRTNVSRRMRILPGLDSDPQPLFVSGRGS